MPDADIAPPHWMAQLHWYAACAAAIFLSFRQHRLGSGNTTMSSLYRASTLGALLESGRDAAPAIGAPEREALSHGELRALRMRTVESLNTMGIGRGDRVAMVLPNGPEMAAAFIAIACGATTAP